LIELVVSVTDPCNFTFIRKLFLHYMYEYKGYIAGMRVTRIAQRILGGELVGNKTRGGTKRK